MTTGTNICKVQHKEGPHYITSHDQNEIRVHTNKMTKIMKHRHKHRTNNYSQIEVK